jgi:hypothetical protein
MEVIVSFIGRGCNASKGLQEISWNFPQFNNKGLRKSNPAGYPKG